MLLVSTRMRVRSMSRAFKKEYKGFCPNCSEFHEGILKERKIETTVRGIKIKATINELYCKECGEMLTSDAVEKNNDIIIYDAYKAKVGLLTSLQIKQIRAKRSMSQAQMALFLDIGEKDITRYENGSIQTKSIDDMIRLMGDDEAFDRMCIVLEKEEHFATDTSQLISAIQDVVSRIVNGQMYEWCLDDVYEKESFEMLFKSPKRNKKIKGEEYGRKELSAQA